MTSAAPFFSFTYVTLLPSTAKHHLYARNQGTGLSVLPRAASSLQIPVILSAPGRLPRDLQLHCKCVPVDVSTSLPFTSSGARPASDSYPASRDCESIIATGLALRSSLLPSPSWCAAAFRWLSLPSRGFCHALLLKAFRQNRRQRASRSHRIAAVAAVVKAQS